MKIDHKEVISSVSIMAADYTERLEAILDREQLTTEDLNYAMCRLQWLEGLSYTLMHLRIWHGFEEVYPDYMTEEKKINKAIAKYREQILKQC